MNSIRHIRKPGGLAGFASLAGLLVSLTLVPTALAQTYNVTPTSSSGVFQGQAEIDGVPASAGDIVVAYDPDGVVAGAEEVIMNGGIAYINMAIYGDDATTAGVDEGMEAGDSFTLALWDASMGVELSGPSVAGWQNTNGSPMPGLDNPSTVFTFQGAVVAPGAPTLSSPQDGATDVATNPVLSWTAVGTATGYNVEVSTDAGFGSTVFSASGQAGTSAGLNGLSLSTTYYWRVQATNSAGTSAWAGPGSFTVRDPVVPPAPLLAQPSNAATDVALMVNFSWQAASDADTYEIQVAGDAGFSGVVESASGIGTTSQTFTVPDYTTTYFWRVRATGAGGTGDWSSVFSFTTEEAPPPPPPAAPSLDSPDDGATGVALVPTLAWAAGGGGATYDVEVATDAAFSDVVSTGADLAGTSFSPSALDVLTTYWWRVRGSNAGGDGNWSAARSFTTVAPNAPGAIVLTAPVDGVVDVVEPVALAWTADDLATGYDVEVATSSDFATGLQSFDAGSQTSLELSGLDHLTTYWWRVRGRNAGGNGAWSAPRSFTTIIEAPGMPGLTAPADGATGQSVSLTLSWSAAARAATYDVEVSRNMSFTSLVAAETNLSAAATGIEGLDVATTYFWRVRAVNAGGTGAWSAVRSFTTIVGAPGAPAPQAPQPGAENVTLPVVLTWAAAGGAASYDLQLSTDSGFGTLIVDVAIANGSTTWTGQGLGNDQTYYWRIRAVNAGGVSAWTETRSFTTIVATPGAVALSGPADGEQGLPTSPVLAWTQAARASTYHVQLALSSDFATSALVADVAGHEANSWSPADLDYLTTYWWRVRAVNVGGYGPWSAARSFMTGPPPPPAVPALTAPADEASALPVIVRLEWSAALSATASDVEVATDEAFQNVVHSRAGVTGAFVETDSLAFSTTYFWRVRARNAGGASAWTAVRSFTTMALPAPPAADLEEPSDKVTGVGGTLVLRWAPVSIAASYDLQVSRFGALLVDETGLQSTSYELTGLDGNTEYFWRVRARNATGTGAWSASFSFVTAVSVAREGAGDSLPVAFSVGASYPNPFHASATVPLELDRSVTVTARVFDLLGRERGILQDGHMEAGRHTLRVHASELGLSPGTYLVHVRTGNNHVAITRLTFAR